jgi:hypothetical protein
MHQTGSTADWPELPQTGLDQSESTEITVSAGFHISRYALVPDARDENLGGDRSLLRRAPDRVLTSVNVGYPSRTLLLRNIQGQLKSIKMRWAIVRSRTCSAFTLLNLSNRVRL